MDCYALPRGANDWLTVDAQNTCQESTAINRILLAAGHFFMGFQCEVTGTSIARW